MMTRSCDNLLEVVKRSGKVSARELVKTMKSEVKKHRSGADPNDDLTLLCLRVE